MNSPKLRFTACLLLSAPCAHAADKNHAAEAPNPAVLLAGVADVSVPAVSVVPSASRAVPASPGTAESLPDMPSLPANFQPPSAASPFENGSAVRGEPRLSVSNVKLPDGSGVSLLNASPLAGAAHRIGAERFNTDDGVSADTFAICYRLNRRSSLQVIPGDPAPVTLPVSTFANNAGVTVGMVVRLSRQR